MRVLRGSCKSPPVEANAMTAEKILTTSRSRSLGTVSDRVVARHEIGERIIISRGFCLKNQTFSFQYPFSGAFWTFCSPKRRFRAVATMSGRLRSCSAKSLPNGYVPGRVALVDVATVGGNL